MTWHPKQLTRAQMMERRQEGARLLRAGKMSQAEIARHLSVSEASLSHWKEKLEKCGAAGLEEHKASGRPPGLSEKDKKILLKRLKAGARASGFETERWTQARVQQVIEREFGVPYHQNYISRLLHDLGWSVQKPEPRAIERDEELIRAWLSQDWPRIKKGAAARRRHRV
jgi:transposase